MPLHLLSEWTLVQRILQVVLLCAYVLAIGAAQDALSQDQWAAKFTCTRNGTTGSHQSKADAIISVCEREPADWRLEYIDEIGKEKFQVRVRENLIDERVANMLDLVNSHRHLDIEWNRFNSGDKQQDQRNRKLVAGPQVDNQLCAEQLQQMIDLLEELRLINAEHRAGGGAGRQNSSGLAEQHIRLARVLDSYGRFQSSMFSGRHDSMGDYKQCIATQLLLRDNAGPQSRSLVDSRYCWARLSMDKHLHRSLKTRRRSSYDPAENLFNVATCLPVSCHSISFHNNPNNTRLLQRLVDSQFSLPQEIYADSQRQIDSVFCLVDQQSEYLEWSLAAKLFMAVMTTWVGLLLAVTISRKLSSEEGSMDMSKNRLMSALDLDNAWDDLLCRFDYQGDNKRVNLDALNGIKVLALAAIVLLHSVFWPSVYMTNYLAGLGYVDTSRRLTIMRPNVIFVDTFLVLSGYFLAYIGIKKIRRLNENLNVDDIGERPPGFLRQLASVWSLMAAKRYLRIVPTLFVAFWFQKSMVGYLGSGPVFDHGLNRNTNAGACRLDSWLTPLTFLSGYNNLMRQCLPHTWYLSTDLYNLMLFAPPIVYLLAVRYTKTAYLLMGALWLERERFAYQTQLAVDPSVAFNTKDMRGFGVMLMADLSSNLYTLPYLRIDRVLIGIIAGHALSVKPNSSSWPNWFRGPATWFAFACLVYPYLPYLFLYELRTHLAPHHRLVSAFHSTTVPTLWCAGNAILFLRLSTDWRDSWFGRFGTSGLVKSLNKLGFLIYVLHWTVEIYLLSSWEHEFYWTHTDSLLIGAAVYLMTTLLAALGYIFIEKPISSCMSLLL